MKREESLDDLLVDVYIWCAAMPATYMNLNYYPIPGKYDMKEKGWLLH